MFRSIGEGPTGSNIGRQGPSVNYTNAAAQSIDRTVGGDRLAALDIHRDFAAVQKTEAKLTTKITPDKVFTLEEKRAWRLAQERLLESREFAAQSISLDYVNAASEAADGYGPFAAAVVEREEEEKRRGDLRSFLKCMRKNGGSPVDLVVYDDDSVRVSGVWRCGSLWQCPRCSSRGLWKYSRRLVDLLSAIQKENARRRSENLPCVSVLFMTLTAPHLPGDPLADQMRLFSGCWNKVRNARGVRSLADVYGLVGSVRCFDHTVSFRDGLSDWHTHFHNLLIFDPAAGAGLEIDDGLTVKYIADRYFEVWADRVKKYGGGRDCSRDAFKVEKVDLTSEDRSDGAIADYVSKIAMLPGYLTKSQKLRKKSEDETEETARPPFRSLAPLELLDAWNAWGNSAGCDYAAAWIEYCAGTKGFHRVQFSKGLEDRFVQTKKKTASEASPVCRHTLPGPVADIALKDAEVLQKLKEACLARDVVLFYDALQPAGSDLVKDYEESMLMESELVELLADCVAEEQPVRPRLLSETERSRARLRMVRGLDLSDLLSEDYITMEEEEAELSFGERLFFEELQQEKETEQ